MTLPVWAWAAMFAAFAALMVADLALTRNSVGLRAAAVSSLNSPPRNRSALRRPSTRLASVTVGSVPPRP